MSEQLSYIWLTEKPGIGIRVAMRLLEVFGSPEAVYNADRSQLRSLCPLTLQQLDALCDKNLDSAKLIIDECARHNIRIITIGDSSYPNRLSTIDVPPLVLYVRGSWLDFDTIPAIAVVGTRRASPYGLEIAERIGRTLGAAGFIVVSGMALGSDAAAHRGAMRAGGLTVAVLADGPDVCYPPQNLGLMGDILIEGAVVSERPPGGLSTQRPSYHLRNRILSGLCVATVITEAPRRSGTLITAHHAVEQGRDVYAVPGGLDALNSIGCNELIREGCAELLLDPAELVKNYRALLQRNARRRSSSQNPAAACSTFSAPARPGAEKIEQPNWVASAPTVPPKPETIPSAAAKPKRAPTPAPEPAPIAASAPHSAEEPPEPPTGLCKEDQLIVEKILLGVSTSDDLIELCGLPASVVMSRVTMLEVSGILRRESGRLVPGWI